MKGLLLILLVATGCVQSEFTTSVKAVNLCAANGMCRVSLETGTDGYMYLPKVGDHVVCRSEDGYANCWVLNQGK